MVKTHQSKKLGPDKIGGERVSGGQPSRLRVCSKKAIVLHMQTGVSLQTLISPPPQLSAEVLPALAPLQLRWQGQSRLEVRHGAISHEFTVVYRPDWSGRSLQAAIQALGVHNSAGMVVLPYLDDEKLLAIEESGLTGLDLCGNATITVADAWLLRFTGRPNRFKIEQPLQNPYQGKAALVGRMLLHQAAFETLEQLHAAIARHGGSLSLSLASRALKQMQADVIVGSEGRYRIYLLQPAALLDRLKQSWQQQKPAKLLWRGRVAAPTLAFLPKLFVNAAHANMPTVMTGIGSASRFTSLSMEDTAYLYSEAAEPLLTGLEAKSGGRFTNLEIYKAPSESVFFDTETDKYGIRWASALQIVLEMQNGDARLQDSSAPLRQQLIDVAIVKQAQAISITPGVA
jgi:hypothetical protein